MLFNLEDKRPKKLQSHLHSTYYIFVVKKDSKQDILTKKMQKFEQWMSIACVEKVWQLQIFYCLIFIVI